MKHFKSQNQLPNRRQESARIRAEANEQQTSFRRNRTLTGSSSGRIASSNELNADLASPRAKIHHLNKRRRGIGIRLAAVVTIGLFIYLAVSQLVANVNIAATSGIQLPANLAGKYNQRIDEYYKLHPMQRFFPSLDQAALTSFLQDSYPEIKQAQLSLGGTFGEAQATITLRQPIVRWDIGDQREFVDENGIVFGYNAFDTPSVQIVDKSGSVVKNASGLVTSHRFLAFVGRVVGDMQTYDHWVTKATIPALTTRQLDIKLRGISPSFKLTVDRSAGEQCEDISRIIAYLKKKSISADYVDVRVEGKAFYK